MTTVREDIDTMRDVYMNTRQREAYDRIVASAIRRGDSWTGLAALLRNGAKASSGWHTLTARLCLDDGDVLYMDELMLRREHPQAASQEVEKVEVTGPPGERQFRNAHPQPERGGPCLQCGDEGRVDSDEGTTDCPRCTPPPSSDAAQGDRFCQMDWSPVDQHSKRWTCRVCGNSSIRNSADGHPHRLCPGQPVRVDELVIPPLNDDLRALLGMMCFEFIHIANAWRRAGASIEPRAEAEQAYCLHWLLTVHAKHGSDWRSAADAELKAALATNTETPR